jgi:NADPH2:quinone reductase
VRAIRISKNGGPEVLEEVELPDPVPGHGELLIHLEATAVNFADILMARGRYPGVRPPFVPGLEAAGTVLSIGPGATMFAPGHRVMGLCRGGSYATRVVLAERSTLPVPGTFSWAEAGAFMETFFTAWHALFTVGRASPGETVLVMAAAGGVGTSALQIAREKGLRVIAAAGSQAKLEQIEQLATAGVVDYSSADLTARVRELTGGRGADVVLESAGGSLAQAAFEALAPLGRLVVFGAASGDFASFPSHKLLGRNVAVLGLHLGHLLEAAPAAMEAAATGLMGLVGQGRLRPWIGQAFSLAQAAEAQERMLSRKSVGKLVLLAGGDGR